MLPSLPLLNSGEVEHFLNLQRRLYSEVRAARLFGALPYGCGASSGFPSPPKHSVVLLALRTPKQFAAHAAAAVLRAAAVRC